MTLRRMYAERSALLRARRLGDACGDRIAAVEAAIDALELPAAKAATDEVSRRLSALASALDQENKGASDAPPFSEAPR